jgi:PPM family protein phosphatase
MEEQDGLSATVEAAGQTDAGRRRARTGDALGQFPEHGLFAVAAGASERLHVGESAAELVVQTLRSCIAAHGRCDASKLKQGLELADRFLEAVSRDSQRPFSVVTSAALSVTEQAVHIAHVGDCRVYRIEPGAIEPMTEDHTIAAMTADSFDARLKDLVVQGLGKRGSVPVLMGMGKGGDNSKLEIATKTMERRHGDIYLLCSPGLHRRVRDKEMLEVVHGQPHLDAAAQSLVERATRRDPEDGVTCLLVRV